MVGTGIKYLRLKQKKTRESFCSKVDISTQHLYAIEANDRYPSLRVLEIIAKELNVNVFLLYWFGFQEKEVKRKRLFRILKPHLDGALLALFEYQRK